METDFPELENKANPYYEIEENLVLIYYNLTRKNNVEPIALLYRRIMYFIKKTLAGDSQQIHYLKLAYKLIAQTRDIYFGKGERELSYAMIYVLYDFYPVLAVYLIHTLVQPRKIDLRYETPYGCWSDMKRLCHYAKQINPEHSIIRICIELMNSTLYKEQSCALISRHPMSNLAKWIPRENKKYGWLFEPLVLDYYKRFSPNHLPSKTHPSYYSAVDRCKMIYRKRIGKLNRLLDTIEIKLCEKRADLIHPANVPLTAFVKHKHSLHLCTFKTPPSGAVMSPKGRGDADCAFQMRNGVKNAFIPFLHEKYYPNQYKSAPPARLPISYFVKEAIRLTVDIGPEIDLLNLQWKDYSDSIGMWILDSYIPIIDMSHFMDKDALYRAIGIACLIAERSTINKKILAFGNQPCWVNLDGCDGIFSMVQTLLLETRSISKTSCSILPAIALLQQSFLTANTPASTIENTKLVILSSGKHEPIVDSCMIIYWNGVTSFQDSLPVPHDEPGVHIFSGDVFLPLFLSSKEKTSYQVVEEILNSNDRYDVLDDYVDKLVMSNF